MQNYILERPEFEAQLDRAILAGESSGSIGKRLGINSATVRRRRTMLRKSGRIIRIRSNEARVVHADSRS